MQYGSYGLKLWRLNEYLFIYFALTNACLIPWISYSPICNGRAGQGAFFFHYSLTVNPVEMWYATPCMTSTSKAKFGKKCGGFSTLNTWMKVSDNEAYQSAMPSNAFIASSNMQGGSRSNINLYTRVKTCSNNRMITPLKLHLDNRLKYVFKIVSASDHAHSKPSNSHRAQSASRM